MEIRIARKEDAVALVEFNQAMALETEHKTLDPDVLTTPLAGQWLDGFDPPATLRRVACPTLLLQADYAVGGALPDAYAAELAALLRDGVRIKLDGIGHNIHGTQPDVMLRLMVPFLDALD